MKPFRDQELLDAILAALQRDSAVRKLQAATHDLQERYPVLTGLEREMMGLVVFGKLNKQIVYEIGISEATVKIHCGHVMDGLRAAGHRFRDHTDDPRCLPMSQDTPPPRTVAAICCPSRCSITGFHGTSENPIPSSSAA